MNICLQKHSSDFLRWHIKAKAKQATELVKVQSVLCEETIYLKRVIVLRYKDLSNKFLVIVIIYAKGVERGITKKINCCCLHQVVNSDIQNCAYNKKF